MKKIILGLMAATAMLLTGCSVVPELSKQQIKELNFGPKPTNISTTEVKNIFSDYKDPDSIHIKLLPHVPFYRVYGNSTKGSGYTAGWMTVVKLNAKNGYGAYTGYKASWILFIDGKPNSYFTDSEARLYIKWVDKP